MGRDMQKRRLEIRNRRQRNKEYRNNRKVEAGKCVFCFAPCNEENVYYFHWDHIDPSLKRFTVAAMQLHSIEEIEKEIAKCQLLCFDCHMERTQTEGHHTVRREGLAPTANPDQLSFDL